MRDRLQDYVNAFCHMDALEEVNRIALEKALARLADEGRARSAKPLNFPTSVRPDLRNMRGLGARVAESFRWSA